jgi:hypothetical protein
MAVCDRQETSLTTGNGRLDALLAKALVPETRAS